MDGFGSLLGGPWEALGLLLGALGRFLGDFGCLLNAPEGLLEASWVHLCCHGRLRSQFWRVQGRFWKGLGGVLEGLGEGFRRALAYIRCMKKCTARLPRLHCTARLHCTPRISSRNGFINAMTSLSHLPRLFFSPLQRGGTCTTWN